MSESISGNNAFLYAELGIKNVPFFNLQKNYRELPPPTPKETVSDWTRRVEKESPSGFLLPAYQITQLSERILNVPDQNKSLGSASRAISVSPGPFNVSERSFNSIPIIVSERLGIDSKNIGLLGPVGAPIPPATSDAVLIRQAALSYLTKDRTESDVNQILKFVEGISDDVLTTLTFYIREGMKGLEVIDILKAVAGIPKDQRLGVLNESKPYVKEFMKGYEVSFILKAVAAIPLDEREGVLNESKPYVKEFMRGYEVPHILKALAAIPLNKRGGIFHESKFYLKEGMKGIEVGLVLTALSLIPDGEGPSVFSASKEYTTEKMGGDVIARIVSTLAAIPSERRAEVCLAGKVFKEERVDVLLHNLELLGKLSEEEKEIVLPSFEQIDKYRNQNIADYLRDAVFSNRSSRKYGEVLKSMFEGGTHKVMLSILPAKWIAEVESSRPLKAKVIQKRLDVFFGSKEMRRAFRNNYNPLRQTYLRVAIALDKEEGVGPMKKLELLSAVCDHKKKEGQVLNELNLLYALLSRGEVVALNALNIEATENLIEDLQESLKASLESDSFIDLKTGIENSSEKYFEKFATARIPFPVETYAAGFRSKDDEPVPVVYEGRDLTIQYSIQRFVRSVLLDTFKQERYNTENNEHLKIIHDYDDGDTLRKWQDLSVNIPVPSALERAESVEFCSRWEDFLFSGTEVEGSCQRIDGDPSVNQCLMAYCLDGKNGMLAVKDKEGKIIVRSMLRLFLVKGDHGIEKPVLFLDRLYPDQCSSERREAILEGAKAASKSLGLDLFTKWDEGSASEVEIESKEGSCVSDYSDAISMVTLGAYKVTGCNKI